MTETTKRFDDHKKIMPYLKKVSASFEKLRAEIKARHEGK